MREPTYPPEGSVKPQPPPAPPHKIKPLSGPPRYIDRDCKRLEEEEMAAVEGILWRWLLGLVAACLAAACLVEYFRG